MTGGRVFTPLPMCGSFWKGKLATEIEKAVELTIALNQEKAKSRRDPLPEGKTDKAGNAVSLP